MWLTPSGLVVPGFMHTIETRPIASATERVTRGLYFKHFGLVVPSDFQVTMFPESLFHLKELAEALEKLKKRLGVRVGKGEFAYYNFVREDPLLPSVWLLEFYEVVRFMALIAKSEGPPHSWWRGPPPV